MSLGESERMHGHSLRLVARRLVQELTVPREIWKAQAFANRAQECQYRSQW